MNKFRSAVRTWLEKNCPPSMRTPGGPEEVVRGGSQATFVNPESQVWLQRMAAKGWTVPQWPQIYGGGGLSAAEADVLASEMARINARSPLQSLDTIMLGPLLLECGSEAQKQRFLPPIARGETLWCQGYSEPGAGSDLASLSTRATDAGDHFLVNGAKIWTSYAHYADWMFCLVRTDNQAPKHQGISFLLLDMASPGISASPIALISGHSPFCETHFNNVKVPKDQLLGGLNQGWSIAKRLLQLERSMISTIGDSELGAEGPQLQNIARRMLGDASHEPISDPELRQHIARHRMNDRAFKLTATLSAQQPGSQHLASMLKLYGTEQNKRLYELLLQIMGTQALGWQGAGFSEDELQTTRMWLRSKANSIEGGSSEIQLNVIAKRVLGLPD